MLASLLALPTGAAAADPAFGRVWMRLNFLFSGQALPGSVITFPVDEVDAWVRVRVPARYPGVRDPKVVLGMGTVTGSATIDFAQVMAGQGKPLGMAGSLFAAGERPVVVSARIESSGGQATVIPTRVEVSGVAVTGSVLDFMVKSFLLPLFPDAKVAQPFEIGLGIDRLEVRPTGVVVTMKKKP